MTEKQTSGPQGDGPPALPERPCRYCREPIAVADKFCRHCGKSQEDAVPWVYRPVGITVLTLFVLGPFGLALVLKSPALTRMERIVFSVVIGAYMYIRCKPKFLIKDMNPSEVIKAEVARMPKFGGGEAMMAVILVLLIIAWIVIGEHAGLGGPTLYAVMAMFLCRIIRWEDIQDGVAFDVAKGVFF